MFGTPMSCAGANRGHHQGTRVLLGVLPWNAASTGPCPHATPCKTFTPVLP